MVEEPAREEREDDYYEDEGRYDFSPDDSDSSPVEEFDYRANLPSEAPPPEERPNPNVLEMVDAYLADAGALPLVRHHIPNLLRLVGNKVADRFNRIQTVHWYSPRIPFRYMVHDVQLGYSGVGKGLTVANFFSLVGGAPGEPPILPTFQFKGGSLESMRGGVVRDRPNDPLLVRPGSIERNDHGFIHVSEFSQVAELGERSGGSLQTILAWADEGTMSYETLSGRAVSYSSAATLINDIQTARLDSVETAVAGWARRSIYDNYTVPLTDSLLPENRPVPSEGDPRAFGEIRAALRSLVKSYRPTRIDWEPFHRWLSDAYRSLSVVAQDEQMLYSVALGHHIMSGGAWTGEIRITVPPSLHAVFERLVRNKRLARIAVNRRVAHEAIAVLEDPYVLGKSGDSWMSKREAVRVIAARISIPEEAVEEALTHAEERGYVEVKPDGDMNHPVEQLRLVPVK